MRGSRVRSCNHAYVIAESDPSSCTGGVIAKSVNTRIFYEQPKGRSQLESASA